MSLAQAFRRSVLTQAALALALGGDGGCGSSDRPPPLTDVRANDAGSNSFTAPPPTVQSCKLGPDGGVCACADSPLVGEPPTLYFVLDRSGSMATDDKWATIIQVLGDLVIALGPRAKIGAAVFPDPADQDSCTVGREVFSPVQGDTPPGIPGPAENALLETLGNIPANGGTPTAATLRHLLDNELKTLPEKTYVILATDGGPNCNETTTCDVSACEPNIESVAGCTPGGPNCCGSNGPFKAGSCLDAQPTVDAVAAIAAAGFPVYVIGVPGSAPYASLLDRLATAGGTASGGAHAYYDVSSADQGAFTSTIFGVAAKITGTCTLTLSQVPPDPSLVNVFLDERPLPQLAGATTAAPVEPLEGGANADASASANANWTLNGATVTLLGASCEKILAGTVVDVRVVAGCPTVER